MNARILEKDVQDYLLKYRENKVTEIALKKSPFPEIASHELAAQIDGWQRCVKKLPTWAYHPNIYYPNRIHIEQSSSEHTAIIKQTLISKGSRLIDITGGLGVDSCYMAQEAESVIHCELNTELSKIASYNAELLGVSNLYCKNADGIDVLKNQPSNYYDYIYIDPSRRKSAGRVFLLRDCEPDILQLQDLFFEKGHTIITKLSPLLDIHSIIEQLKWIEYIYVISLDNECKELLVIQRKNQIGIPKIRCIRLYKDLLQDFIFTYPQEKSIESHYATPKKWLYDPDVSITKAGAFKSVGHRHNLLKLAQHSHLYTSDNYVADFPGRVFKVIDVQSFSDFKKNNKIKKANISSKNFPLKVTDIRKRYKITEGGELFCYFTSDSEGKQIVIHCQRVY